MVESLSSICSITNRISERFIFGLEKRFFDMLGMLEIQRLRSLAEEELGAKFDLRDFHDRVLENGSITLPMLEASIMAWIGQK